MSIKRVCYAKKLHLYTTLLQLSNVCSMFDMVCLHTAHR